MENANITEAVDYFLRIIVSMIVIIVAVRDLSHWLASHPNRSGLTIRTITSLYYALTILFFFALWERNLFGFWVIVLAFSTLCLRLAIYVLDRDNAWSNVFHLIVAAMNAPLALFSLLAGVVDQYAVHQIELAERLATTQQRIINTQSRIASTQSKIIEAISLLANISPKPSAQDDNENTNHPDKLGLLVDELEETNRDLRH